MLDRLLPNVDRLLPNVDIEGDSLAKHLKTAGKPPDAAPGRFGSVPAPMDGSTRVRV